MELSIERAALAKLLGAFRTVIEPRPLVPAYGALRLTATAGVLSGPDGMLTVSGQGRVIAAMIQSTTPVTVLVPGDVLLPAAQLTDVVAAFSDATVRVVQKGSQIEVLAGRAGRARIAVAGDVADFTSVSEPESASTWSVEPSAATFVAGLRRVLHAASTDDTRPMMHAIRVEEHGAALRMVTADGYRLSTTNWDDTALRRSMLIPYEAIRALVGLVPSQSAEPVTIRSDDSRASFYCGAVACSVPLIGSEFPDYQRIIRPVSTDVVRVAPGAALQALAVARAMQPESKMVHLYWEADRLLIVSEHAESGIAVGEAAAEIVSGGPGAISVSAAYLKDALDALDDAEAVDLAFEGMTAIMLTPSAGAAHGMEIVMPMSATGSRPSLASLPGAEVPDPVPQLVASGEEQA